MPAGSYDPRVGRGADSATQWATSRPRAWGPERAHARCRVLDDREIEFDQLPQRLREDEDLLRNIDARYGSTVGMKFKLIELPLDLLDQYVVKEDIGDFYAPLIESDEMYDEQMLHSGEEPEWDYENAADRQIITEGYRDDFAAGRDVLPIVVDFHNLPDQVDLLDGYHRATGAYHAKRQTVQAYELLPAETLS